MSNLEIFEEGTYLPLEYSITSRKAIGLIHTNGLENFWCLLKRSIRGTYVSVDAEHLFRYLHEQAYRFNYRGGKDSDRFLRAMKSVAGKRLTYSEVTGKPLD